MNQTLLMQLRDRAASDYDLQTVRADQLALAQKLKAEADARVAESGPAFAAAILAAGGEVFDTTTLPTVQYRSADGKTFESVKVVEITDEAVPAPESHPAD